MTEQTIDLAEFARAVSKTAHEHGWWDDPATGRRKLDRNMGEMLMLMTSELAEGLEAWRDGEPVLWYEHKLPSASGDGREVKSKPGDIVSAYQKYNGVLGKPCGLASEFADTIIRILDTTETLQIPLIQALLEKAEYNETRPYRHGGKLA